MKKTIFLFAFAFLIYSTGFSQAPIPNGGFENWSGPNPTGWGSSDGVLSLLLGDPGGVERDTNGANVNSGNSSVRLTTKNVNLPQIGAQNIPGVVSLGTLGLNFQTFQPEITGFAYTDRPDSVSFFYKYAAGSGGSDTGAVIVTLTRYANGEQQFVGNAFVFLSESVNFQEIKAKINYFTMFAPDTLLIQGLSSSSQNAVQESTMFLDDMGFVGLDTAFKAYINPPAGTDICDGETTILSTDDFGTANTYLWYKDNAPISAASNFNLVVASAGNYFVKVTRNGTDYFSDTITVSLNPSPQITFNLVDSVCINVNSVTLVASPTGGTFSGTGVSGTNLNTGLAGEGVKNVTYSFTDTITGCSAEKSEVLVIRNCTSIETFLADVKANIFPNPASNAVLFDVNNQLLDGTVQLFDINGKMVETLAIKNNIETLNIKALTNGTYFVKILNKEGKLAVSSNLQIMK